MITYFTWCFDIIQKSVSGSAIPRHCHLHSGHAGDVLKQHSANQSEGKVKTTNSSIQINICKRNWNCIKPISPWVYFKRLVCIYFWDFVFEFAFKWGVRLDSKLWKWRYSPLRRRRHSLLIAHCNCNWSSHGNIYTIKRLDFYQSVNGFSHHQNRIKEDQGLQH